MISPAMRLRGEDVTTVTAGRRRRFNQLEPSPRYRRWVEVTCTSLPGGDSVGPSLCVVDHGYHDLRQDLHVAVAYEQASDSTLTEVPPFLRTSCPPRRGNFSGISPSSSAGSSLSSAGSSLARPGPARTGLRRGLSPTRSARSARWPATGSSSSATRRVRDARAALGARPRSAPPLDSRRRSRLARAGRAAARARDPAGRSAWLVLAVGVTVALAVSPRGDRSVRLRPVCL